MLWGGGPPCVKSLCFLSLRTQTDFRVLFHVSGMKHKSEIRPCLQPDTLCARVTLHLVPVLKEQCHEDFAVLGPFCAKIITLRL